MSGSTAALVGAWSLVAYTTTSLDGTGVRFPMGVDARGLLVYTADGYMSVQISSADRAKYLADELHGGTKSERTDAAAGYLAYAGRFSTAPGGIVTHVPDVSLFPDWKSRPILRRAVLHHDELTLGLIEPIMADGMPRTGLLTWRRVGSRTPRLSRGSA